jgi:colicin import membrane protein
MDTGSPKPTAATEDPFRYGWRDVPRKLPDGGVEIDRVPLTLEDVLHPQEGDKIMENTQHERDCRYLADVFSTREFGPPHFAITHDLRVDWGVEGIRGHSPDVGVFVRLNRPLPEGTATLEVKDYKARPVLIVEVVSPSTRVNDVATKFSHYHTVGVPFYVIIDQEKEDGPRVLRAFRRAREAYVEVPLDPEGQVMLPRLDLRLGLADDRVVCFDALTGEELGDYQRITRALEEADRRFEQQTQELEDQILARQQAERDGRNYQQEADRQRQARELAERQARDLDEKASQRIRELEALLRSLQHSGGDPHAAS